jgi:hypothetical protein
VVGRRKEIIARGTNAPFAIGARSARAAWQAAGTGRSTRRPPSPFFRRGFPDRAAASLGPSRQINDADIRFLRAQVPRPIPTFTALWRPLSAFADARGGAA